MKNCLKSNVENSENREQNNSIEEKKSKNKVIIIILNKTVESSWILQQPEQKISSFSFYFYSTGTLANFAIA